ncbi:uncharacterized protein TRAVEDRAFT_43957 [Trametes versicolor FP-101664 SS1]|uniref:uncharacterized protein n=1 Tax=Trametes versicolor (strain FP-101664) TaxID=717944 RepID=UPI0004621AD2|nr:uncharacterized protein TRAVEDRAFT_43957 [Trametes versicolor FP-101664 SS1]EIW63680.1 hypothetical protein TRAVEDRAFT_43957 [Trametes versicolor FP-101664 SS1]
MPTAATPESTLRLFVDSWTSHAGRGSFTSVVARIEDNTTEVNFTLPDNYADLAASRARWEGWLEVINHPTGQGMFPASTTERQRAALRGLARTLVLFSIDDANGEHRRDWPHLINHIREIAAREGLTGERQLELVLDWARVEYQTSNSWRAERARARDATATTDANTTAETRRDVREAASAGDSDDSEAVQVAGYDSDSSIPSLVTVCHSDSE